LYNDIGVAQRRLVLFLLPKEVRCMDVWSNIISIVADVLAIVLAIIAFRGKK